MLSGLAYVRTLDAPFSPADVSAVLLKSSLADVWHPVTSATLVVDRYSWGISSFGFHVTNLCVHAVVVGLVFRAAAGPGSNQGQTGVRHGSDPGLTPFRLGSAFAAAVVFGLNPLTATTVRSVSARAELLAAVGLTGGYILVDKARGSVERRWLLMAAGCLAFAIAANPFVRGLSLANYLYLPALAAIVALARRLPRFSSGRAAPTRRQASGRVRA